MHPSRIEALEPAPADALLGLMTLFRADNRPNKIDLGVGVYRNTQGQTPVMLAVKEAERELLITSETKVYEGPRGNLDFCRHIEKLIFGRHEKNENRSDITSLATPGGCGALSASLSFLNRLSTETRVWISNPCWVNYQHLINAAGLASEYYPYAGSAQSPGQVDFTQIRDSLMAAKAGDAIIIEGPCHNPSGCDLTAAEWSDLADICVMQGLFPILDIAYHGFGKSLEDDLTGVRNFLSAVPEALVSYSCSKNFSLYRERTGCLLIKTQNSQSSFAASSHLASIARASYSMPPAHGAAIVATILDNDSLRVKWENELDTMRNRIEEMRGQLSKAFAELGYEGESQSIRQQKGMFSILKLKPGAVKTLQEREAIYVPGNGRINVAGLQEEDVQRVADCIAPLLESSQLA